VDVIFGFAAGFPADSLFRSFVSAHYRAKLEPESLHMPKTDAAAGGARDPLELFLPCRDPCGEATTQALAYPICLRADSLLPAIISLTRA
jgi:hypothetical protein